MKSDIESIRRDVTADTKSSAGDKFETSREMMKQEENNALSSLSVLNNQLTVLNGLDLRTMNKVELGSLVKTTKGVFFISVALGMLKINEDSFFAISTDAPIYSVLKNKMEGETVSFNNITYQILTIE